MPVTSILSLLSDVLRTSERQKQALTEAAVCAPVTGCTCCPEALICMLSLSLCCGSQGPQANARHSYTSINHSSCILDCAGMQYFN